MRDDEWDDDDDGGWETPPLAECIGGPLDGLFVVRDSAFPWPHGWYYLKPSRGGMVWDGEAGCYTPDDHERWLRGTHWVWEP